MLRHIQIGVVTIAISLASGLCSAQVIIDTYPDWEGRVTNGWLKVAQSFTVPVDYNTLDNYMFALDPRGTQDTVTVEIYEWDNALGPIGDRLFAEQMEWPVSGGDVVVQNIGLALPVGQLYAVVVDLEGYSSASVHWQDNQRSYSDGDASWYNGTWQYLDSGWNTKFRAEFVGESGIRLEAGGSCPGLITLDVTNATSGGRVAFAWSFVAGNWEVPGGPCAGTILGIVQPTVAGIVSADGEGNASLSGNVPPPACGRIFVQAVDITTCEPSNVEAI